MQGLDWTGAAIRGARTFAQSFGGALSSLQVVDAFAKDVRIPIWGKLWAGLLGAAISGASAFFSNLGGPRLDGRPRPKPRHKVKVKTRVKPRPKAKPKRRKGGA